MALTSPIPDGAGSPDRPLLATPAAGTSLTALTTSVGMRPTRQHMAPSRYRDANFSRMVCVVESSVMLRCQVCGDLKATRQALHRHKKRVHQLRAEPASAAATVDPTVHASSLHLPTRDLRLPAGGQIPAFLRRCATDRGPTRKRPVDHFPPFMGVF